MSRYEEWFDTITYGPDGKVAWSTFFTGYKQKIRIIQLQRTNNLKLGLFPFLKLRSTKKKG
ncbi:MAG: hypothetical protein ACK46O_04440 [Flavobacteriia bacterium]